MQADTDHTMQTSCQSQGMDTKPGAKPSTPEPNLEDFTRASARWLEASALHKEASAVMHDAIAAAHEFDPYLVDFDRSNLAACMRHAAENDRLEAAGLRRRAAELLKPEVPATLIAEPAPDVHAEVHLTIRRDRVDIRAALHMGRPYRAGKTFARTGAGSWRHRASWIDHQDGLGIELAEYLDGLDFPDRVADMLPRPAADSAAAAARAAEAVRRG